MCRVIPTGSVRDPRALPEMIADQLLAAVSDGRLKPGEKLPIETELARQMGVGRTSLREAIQKLRAMGVLEVRKGRGTFVMDSSRLEPVRSFVQWSVENEFEVTELLEARMALETAAAGLAAARATTGDLTRLRRASAKHVGATQIEALIDTDESFHSALIAAAHNDLIGRLYAMLVPGLRDFRRMSLAIPASAERSGVTHDDIVAAVASNDPRAAREATAEHLWPLYSSVTRAASRGRRSAERRPAADRQIWFLN
jgi:GntR family transcriptional repressor for pyruvate dehydrogenase complex